MWLSKVADREEGVDTFSHVFFFFFPKQLYLSVRVHFLNRDSCYEAGIEGHVVAADDQIRPWELSPLAFVSLTASP